MPPIETSVDPDSVAIVFADICGSTQLYESKGDAAAYELNGRSLEVMKAATLESSGTVVRTQGDGMLCTFPTAETAFVAAARMQEQHGIHVGPTLRGVGGDVYGDAVNLAARISSLARGGETLFTEQTVLQLPGIYKLRTRLLDSTTLKGKSEPVKIFLLVNETDASATMMDVPRPIFEPKANSVLLLSHGSQQVRLGAGKTKVVVGRGVDCDLVVESTFASRQHASIEVRRDRFVVLDQSSNGTFVSDERAEPIFLKRESTDLGNTGIIFLGARPGEDPASEIRFQREG